MIRALVLFIALFSLAGCQGQSGSEAQKSEENPTPSPSPSSGSLANRRIICCAPNLTEILFALGLGDEIVGVTRFCMFPPDAATKPPLGDLFQPNLEAMAAAKPDLIVMVPGNRKVHEFFEGRSGTKIIETNACETIADIENTILHLGSILSRESRARSMVNRIEIGLDSLRTEYDGAPKFRYLMVLGHDEGSLEQIYVTGQDNYLTELLRILGGENVVESKLGRYPIVNREALVALNPEIIIERHLGGKATKKDRDRMLRLWQQMPTLDAVKNKRVVLLDDDHVTIPGPDLVRSAKVLAELTQPTP